jgi:hypothetical protein
MRKGLSRLSRARPRAAGCASRRRPRFALSSASLCYNANMTDNPATTPPREPLVLPPNFRDVTAERVGTVTGIIGATATKPG